MSATKAHLDNNVSSPHLSDSQDICHRFVSFADHLYWTECGKERPDTVGCVWLLVWFRTEAYRTCSQKISSWYIVVIDRRQGT